MTQPRLYAIGDIHGQARLLRQMHQAIERDAADLPDGARRVVVHLGDYVDRGLRTDAVLDRLAKGPPPGWEWIYLKGNHEDMLLTALSDPGRAALWLANGGDAVLAAYGVEHRRDLAATMQALRRAMPAAHLRFLESLSLKHFEDPYLFVHAGIEPGVPIEHQREETLMWIRWRFLNHPGPLPAVVVHGHTPTERVEFLPWRIGVDTGAFATGRLSAVVLDGEARRVLAVEGAPE